jgi:hypothetical protein
MAENNKAVDIADIESESLEAHVAICSLRYQNLDDKLNAVSQNVDEKFTSLKSEISEIKDSVKTLTNALESKTSASNEKWFSIGTYVIGGLLSICGALALHFLH